MLHFLFHYIFCSPIWCFDGTYLLGLTFLIKGVVWLTQLYTPIASETGVLPMAKRSIITLTLVISREAMRPAVTRGLHGMNLRFFKIKTKLETQAEEYVAFKAKSSPFIAEDQRAILCAFIRHIKCKTVADITPDLINAYHERIKTETTPFTTIKVMQAIRAFLRFHKAFTPIKPDRVTNRGVDLPFVGESDILPPMTRPFIGRPPRLELAKKIKRLHDREGLSFRAIAKALDEDLKSVYRWYKLDVSRYTLPNKLAKKLSTEQL